MAPRQLEMSHEWGAFALLDLDSGNRLDPANLPLPLSVCQRINAWSARWDVTFDVDDPRRSKVDDWVIEELARDGAKLWKAVIGSLPPQQFQVSYRHQSVLYQTPADLPDRWRLA